MTQIDRKTLEALSDHIQRKLNYVGYGPSSTYGFMLNICRFDKPINEAGFTISNIEDGDLVRSLRAFADKAEVDLKPFENPENMD